MYAFHAQALSATRCNLNRRKASSRQYPSLLVVANASRKKQQHPPPQLRDSMPCLCVKVNKLCVNTAICKDV
jgi:hypothetical protein